MPDREIIFSIGKDGGRQERALGAGARARKTWDVNYGTLAPSLHPQLLVAAELYRGVPGNTRLTLAPAQQLPALHPAACPPLGPTCPTFVNSGECLDDAQSP